MQGISLEIPSFNFQQVHQFGEQWEAEHSTKDSVSPQCNLRFKLEAAATKKDVKVVFKRQNLKVRRWHWRLMGVTQTISVLRKKNGCNQTYMRCEGKIMRLRNGCKNAAVKSKHDFSEKRELFKETFFMTYFYFSKSKKEKAKTIFNYLKKRDNVDILKKQYLII